MQNMIDTKTAELNALRAQAEEHIANGDHEVAVIVLSALGELSAEIKKLQNELDITTGRTI